MALKNSEYNAILRQYDQRQFQNRRSQEKCRQRVYEEVPKYGRWMNKSPTQPQNMPAKVFSKNLRKSLAASRRI